MSVALLSVAAVALDALLGEPKRWRSAVLPTVSSNVSMVKVAAGAAMASLPG